MSYLQIAALVVVFGPFVIMIWTLAISLAVLMWRQK